MRCVNEGAGAMKGCRKFSGFMGRSILSSGLVIAPVVTDGDSRTESIESKFGVLFVEILGTVNRDPSGEDWLNPAIFADGSSLFAGLLMI